MDLDARRAEKVYTAFATIPAFANLPETAVPASSARPQPVPPMAGRTACICLDPR